MGGFNQAWDAAKQDSNARILQRRAQEEQQRVEQQNTVGARLLDSINNASNIKPTTKHPDTGEEIPNPAYAQAQKDKQDLITQYMGLNSPQQHATFADRLHGLIFGHPTDQHQQPALSPNSSPVAPAATPAAPGTPPPPAGPAHPFEQNNPVLAKMQEGLGALKNHLTAAAHPLTPPPAVDAEALARQYRDPGEVAAERAQALWGQKGANALAVQVERNKAIMASLQARPPRLLAQTTIPDLLEQMKVDPTMTIYGPEGRELTPGQLAEMPKGTIAREFRAGSQIFYALGDQNSKTLNVNGMIYSMPAVGPVNASGPNANLTPIGQATSTLPHTSTNVTTDPFGLQTKSAATRQTIVPQIAPPAFSPPTAGTAPTLLRRDTGEPATAAPTIVPVNPGARPPGTIPSGGAVKSKPVSAAAPSVPSSAPLDADGHIPPGTGNDLVRQYANNLLDGQDSKDIPNPRARAAAEAMASQYGWSRGAFTPREKVQFNTATTFLHQLKGEDANGNPLPEGSPLKVLDSFISRQKIASAMKDPSKMGIADRIIAFNLNPQEAEFLRLMDMSRGVVAGLSSITRPGRTTNAQVGAISTELPNVFRSSSSGDADKRIGLLLKEADIALHTNPRDVGKKGPVSANAPVSPGTTPKRPEGVPANAVWNQSGNNGAGSWQTPKAQ